MRKKAIIITIFFGLICGLLFIPLSRNLGHIFDRSTSFYMALWAYLALYGFFLSRLSMKPFLSILFPVLLLFLAIFAVHGAAAFVLMTLGILSWIRSSICFEKPLVKQLMTEIVLSMGGGLLVVALTPDSAFTWAMGVWMFFLLQALFFVVLETGFEVEEKSEIDAFEKARLKAEIILSMEKYETI